MIDVPCPGPEISPQDLVDCPECKRLCRRSVKVRRVAGLTLPLFKHGAELVHDAWNAGVTTLDLSPEGCSTSALCTHVYRD